MKHPLTCLCFLLILSSCLQDESKQQEITLKETRPGVQEKQAPSDTFETITPPPANSDALEQNILDIRAEFQRINSAKLVEKKEKFVCDVEGSITYYLENGRVVKVKIDWGFIGDGSSVYEYYYKEGKLVFTYKVHVGGPAGLPETRNEERIYVKNDKTIRYIKNEKVLPCSTCHFNVSSREYKVLRAFEKGDVRLALCN